jgi:hypothetical protein
MAYRIKASGAAHTVDIDAVGQSKNHKITATDAKPASNSSVIVSVGIPPSL